MSASFHLIGGGVASLLPDSAAGFALAVIETAWLVAAMLLWRSARTPITKVAK
jgi:hypothetical protein